MKAGYSIQDTAEQVDKSNSNIIRKECAMGTSKLRESNLEYLRILSMIFIVAGHSVLHGGWRCL